jgi:hypothetical protein
VRQSTLKVRSYYSTCSGMTKGMDPKPSVVEASTMVKVKVRTRFNMIFKGLSQ